LASPDALTRIRGNSLLHMHTCTPPLVHMRPASLRRTCGHTCRHAHSEAQTEVHMHAHIHKNMHTYAHTHTHTNTQTHTQLTHTQAATMVVVGVLLLLLCIPVAGASWGATAVAEGAFVQHTRTVPALLLPTLLHK